MGVSHMMKRVSWVKQHARLFSTHNASVRVELVYEKMITPSSPTPKHLKHYKLSFLDQLLRNQYIPITLFYPNISTYALSSSSSSSIPLVASTLEKSLAKLLSFYYPCAGKLVDNSHVDCNDTGVLFSEIRVKGSLFEMLTKEYSTVQGTLFPEHGVPWMGPSEGSTLAVAQLTHFDCGGIAVSICLTHKISDGCGLGKFCTDWAELARNSSTFLANPPKLVGSSMLQPKDDPLTPDLYYLGSKQHLSVARLNFNLATIQRLQAIVASESDVKDPTRVEFITAHINRCATISSGSFDPYTICLPMNLRKLVNPSVPNYFGNFFSVLQVNVSREGDLKLPKLVSKIRKQKMRTWEKYKGKSKDEVLARIIEEETRFPKDDFRLTSSMCKYKLYDIDFGWGRPTRVTIGAIRSDNNFLLVDVSESGGIDVFASLDQIAALKFKNDKELLEFGDVDLSY